MLLRIAFLTFVVAYVAYRISLALRIRRARRRGDAERELSLRRQSFWALQGVILLLLLAVLFFLGILGINH
jgi:low temperature requirement protein LtrA